MFSMSRVRNLLIVAMPVAAALFSPPASAQSSTESFYSGKRLHFIVGSRPGGGYDTYARSLVPFLTKHLPGHPNMIVENRPGGGGLLSSNHLYNIAAKDGLVIGMLERGAQMEPLLNPKDTNALFDPRKFNWIGTPSQEIGLAMVRTSTPIKTFEDFKTHEVLVSATTRTGLASIYPRLMNSVFGTKFKVIEGYKSSSEMLLAVERGEVDGHIAPSSAGTLRATIAPWIAEGKVKIVMQIGLEKDPAYPQAAMFTDYITKQEDKELFLLMFSQQRMAFPVAAPPGVPADRVAALRAAFDKTMQDPEYAATLEKINFSVDAVSGVEIHKLLDEVYKTPQSVIERYKQMTAE